MTLAILAACGIAGAATAFAGEVLHEVKPDETLSGILDQENVRPIYGEKGWLQKNINKNSFISDWRLLRPGQILRLELPDGSEQGIPNPSLPNPSLKVIAQKENVPSPATPSPEHVDRNGMWLKKVSVSYGRASRFESVMRGSSTADTDTVGLNVLPSLLGELMYVPDSGQIQGQHLEVGGDARIEKPLALNGVSFPWEWEFALKAKWRNQWRISKWEILGHPEGGISYEKFAQATPDFSNSNHFIARTTQVVWVNGGACFSQLFFKSEACLIPAWGVTGTSSTDSGSDIRVHGWRAVLAWSLPLAFHDHLLSEVNVLYADLKSSAGDDFSQSSWRLGIGWSW
jgi:hypothetical protein